MINYNYILFDLDGTLLDTSEGVSLAIEIALKKCEKIIPNRSIIESFIGPPIQDSFEKFYNITKKESASMANIFREEYMKEDSLFLAKPYPGIYNLLSVLSENLLNIGIVTNKREDYANKLLKEKKFSKYTKYIYGTDKNGLLKKQDLLIKCLDDMGSSSLYWRFIRRFRGCKNNRHFFYSGLLWIWI